MGAQINAYRVFLEQPEGNKPHWRLKCKWEDNIKMDIRENLSMCGSDWSESGWDQWWAVVNTVMNHRVSYHVGNFLSDSVTVDLSRTTQPHGASELIILWQAPDTQIDGASIPRQRLGKRLVTLLCKSWLRIPTFPKQRILLYFVSNEVVATTIREELTSYESNNSRVSYSLASKERRHPELTASLKARSYRPVFKERRHLKTALTQDIRGSVSTVKEWL
jgi:hypothetical protein